MLCSSVTCAVHSANRTHHAGHVGFHTRAHVKNPSVPNSPTQPGLCPSAGPANPPRAFPDRVLTLAAVHVGVSSVARHGPPVRCRADPARSRSQLQPLPGICSATVTVVVAIQPTRSCVLRRPDCTQLHSHSYRETRPHACALTRGVSTTQGGSHTLPPPARTWFLPPAVPLSHTACREARTPAHS